MGSVGKVKPATKLALVMSKPSKALDEEDDDDVPDASASSDEVLAYRAFESAKGPEARAAALKQFISLCKGY